MQFVRLVNKDKRPFDFHQSNQKRIIPPGGEIMVPWDIATSLFGDPAATDSTTDPSRTRAWKQSRGQFGYVLGGMTQEEWEEIRPKVEVYDVETGDRIYMVIEDPEGLLVNGGTPLVSESTIQNAALEQQIALMQKQVEALTNMLMNQNAETTPRGQSAFSSEDAATQPESGVSLPPALAGEDIPQTPPTGPKGPKSGHKLAPKPDGN